ncbi:MAG TPA: hypothetical protein VGI44_15000 [Acidimicrobiales bacterium]
MERPKEHRPPTAWAMRCLILAAWPADAVESARQANVAEAAISRETREQRDDVLIVDDITVAVLEAL